MLSLYFLDFFLRFSSDIFSVFPRSAARAGQKSVGFVRRGVSEVCLRYGLHSESRYVSEIIIARPKWNEIKQHCIISSPEPKAQR